MKFLENFFHNLGFDFRQTLKSKEVFFSGDDILQTKLKNDLFFYENPNHTNTSFYLIKIFLEDSEFAAVRKYIWNENKATLIFYAPNTENVILYYAKAAPNINLANCEIDKFNPANSDIEKLGKIQRWQFDSGAFWLNYQSFLKRAKYKSLDKELTSTLSALKKELEILLSGIESNLHLKSEIVQALIDRTLYIKYLEDNHIINSYFYNHYFGNAHSDYKTLLLNSNQKALNLLFKIIHEIFNNGLFDKPSIEEKYLTKEVCCLIYNSLTSNLSTGQLRLFDFRFDVIPVEFISFIYEIFLSDKQKKNGIYYTPKKLAQLILDDVICDNEVGKVLDPSCGSGMFLIIAFQKLLENCKEDNNWDIEKRIEFRTKLLSENIFGIEKEITAQRFTLFSLYLQLFRGLDFPEIKKYIAKQLKDDQEINLFKKYSFFDNIICANSLSQENPPFINATFDFIIGNPPFFEIKQSDEEISFIKDHKIKINKTVIQAKNIIGKHQISQCFLLKIKNWSHPKTRFGFVSNSSNFYNENSQEFQNFFYENYKIKKIYELSKVKKILFENAKENVLALIFSNQITKENLIEYYPVDLGIFSEKPFELLIIQEDKTIEICQSQLQEGLIRLRDFLTGNEYDRNLIDTLNGKEKLKKYIIRKNENKYFIHRGIQIVGFKEIETEFNISKQTWDTFSSKQKKDYFNKFKKKYTRREKSQDFNTPFIQSKDIKKFLIAPYSLFAGEDTSNFHRPRTEKAIFEGEKIIWCRIGNTLKAAYNQNKVYFDFDLYVIKLNQDDLYYFITAILNSKISDWYINLSRKKRLGSSFPKIGIEDIKNIPIPNYFDKSLVSEISNICRDLTHGELEFSNEISNKLNELIFELYDLSYTDRQRIKDYFLPNGKTSIELRKSYSETLREIISMYLKNPIEIEFSKTDFDLIVAKIRLNSNKVGIPNSNKTKYYILNEIFEENPSENFIVGQEKIYGSDCVYIIRKDLTKNWTETKAFEDGQELLKQIIPNE